MTNKEKNNLLKLFEESDIIQEFIDMEQSDFIDFILMNYERSKNLYSITFTIEIKDKIIIDAYIPLHDYAYFKDEYTHFDDENELKDEDDFIDNLNQKMICEYSDEIKYHLIDELLKYNKIARDYYMEINA